MPSIGRYHPYELASTLTVLESSTACVGQPVSHLICVYRNFGDHCLAALVGLGSFDLLPVGRRCLGAHSNCDEYLFELHVIVVANATCLAVSGRGQRNSSRMRARCSPVVNRSFENRAGDSTIWLGSHSGGGQRPHERTL
ncbi:hypothetical protein TNCV_1982621 [Trichonephila clavipes]|nr:hypothetical protein TNCV_1982621 [Trichonephila clavipes]